MYEAGSEETQIGGVMNAAYGQLTYSNGGHEPPILYRKITGGCLELKADGITVGAFVDSEYAEATIELRQGDALLLLTDGLGEARNNPRMLGSGGLADILRSVYTSKFCLRVVCRVRIGHSIH
ncbi:serine/threonine-protein phosphatase [bacterium]|nr:serine/threonine-protein phosphatase [bacterium]